MRSPGSGQQCHACVGIHRWIAREAVVFLDEGRCTQAGAHRSRLQPTDADGPVGELGVQHRDQRGKPVLGDAVSAPECLPRLLENGEIVLR